MKLRFFKSDEKLSEEYNERVHRGNIFFIDGICETLGIPTYTDVAEAGCHEAAKRIEGTECHEGCLANEFLGELAHIISKENENVRYN